MPKLTIDGKEVEVETGATILDAARKIGIDIPTMCFLEGHERATSCMVCLVKVNGAPKMVPSCAVRAAEGMVVESDSDEVIAARRTALELLLGDHVGDCVGPCESVCPARMDIPAMIGHISKGEMRKAIATVKRHIALPAVLGRICPELCEKGCRRSVYDKAVSICMLKRFAADIDLASDRPYLPDCKPSSGRQVAVIGAGPAGLSAAYYLQQQGHSCVVFDDHAQPGGMLRYGVSADRLPHSVLDSEIALIQKLGAQFRLGSRIASAEALDGLCREFDAVLTAVGQVDQDLASRLGLPAGKGGLQVDKATMMTAKPGVFAAGSSVTPSRLAVRSVAHGRSAAFAITRFLEGSSAEDPRKPLSIHIGRLMDDEIAVFMDGASASARTTPSGVGFSEEEAIQETRRCLHCECGKLHSCKLRDYGTAYSADSSRFKGERQQFSRRSDHPFVVYESGKCISCGLCVQLTEEAGEELGLTFVGRGFNVRPGVPFNEPLSKALRKVAEECVRACPTGALVMVKDAQTN